MANKKEKKIVVFLPKKSKRIFKCLYDEFPKTSKGKYANFKKSVAFITEYINLSKSLGFKCVSMSSTYIKSKYGDVVYESLINGYLSKIVVRGDAYSNDFGKGFCKSFKLKDEYMKSSLYHVKICGINISRANKYWFPDESKGFLNRDLVEKGLNSLSIDNKDFGELDADIYMSMSKNSVDLKDWKLSRKDRVYSAVTNMKKSVRRCLRMNGSPITWVDVKCCQPYLALSYLSDEREYRIWSNMLDRDFYNSILKFNKFYEGLGNDRARMKQLVSAFLAGCGDGTSKYPLGNCKYDDPDELTNDEKHAIHQFMKRAFPVFYKEHKKGRKEKHSYLSLALMKLESDVIIDRVLPELDFDAVTIHDCIGCEPKNADRLKQVMMEKFEGAIGVSPKLDVDSPVSFLQLYFMLSGLVVA
ncbi:hypothetical protein [Rubritalea marina]|uniref:hypothetical protein n=1 Tax=Rubritalea marina TaxID=361055 RepID=UPI000364311D|nr:hypothetical protein [Rubritalea marina]